MNATVKLAARTLRRAGRGDERALLEMYRIFQPHGAAAGLPPVQAEEWLASLRGNPAFLMEAGGKVVGHAILCPVGDSGEAALFVHQDWRADGIGEELLYALIAEARSLGLCAVWGHAQPGNTAMIRLARRLDFVPHIGNQYLLRLDQPKLSQGGPAMTDAERVRLDLVKLLKFELEFLEKGGYGRSPRAPWRPQFIFEDSPTCLNYDSKENPEPCDKCALMQFVPPDKREEKTPCRHIPLNARGDTLDGLYRWGTQQETEEAVAEWLRAMIANLEPTTWERL